MKRVLHTPKDRDEIYRRFITYVEEWRVRLVLREWSIVMHLETTDFKQDGRKSGAFTEALPKYYEATITLHLPGGEEWANNTIEDMAIHELMHISVSSWCAGWEGTHLKPLPTRIANTLIFMEEQLCTRLALGFMRTKYPRRKG